MSKNAKVRAVAVWALLATLFVATTGCTITVDPDAAAPARYRESVKVTPAAAKLVGDKSARAAAKVASDFTLAYGTDPILLDPQKHTYTAAELSRGIPAIMTPTAKKEWMAYANQARGGNIAAFDQLSGLKIVRVDEPTWRVPEDGDLIQSQQLTEVTVDAAPVTAAKPKRVSVKMMHRTVAHYNTDKSPVEAYFDRQLTYVMEPAAKGAWKLAQYEGPYTVESYSLLR